MSIDDDIADLNAIKQALNGRVTHIRRELARLRAARGDERVVNDHALIRYLERHKGVDIEAIRNEIRELADSAVPAKDGEHYRHEPSGVMLILDEAGRVVTVLSPEQAEKWTGRFDKVVKKLLDTPPKPKKRK